MKLRTLFFATVTSSIAFAETSGDTSLKLWQISFIAPTRYADGYTVTGKAKQFTGGFSFSDGTLKNLTGRVKVESLSTGLQARDENVRNILFTTADGRIPDLEFKADPATCAPADGGYQCQVQGHFKVQDEWQTGLISVHINTYNNKPWVHAEGTLVLSKFKFYQNGTSALKVADEVKVTVDLLGD